MAVVSVVAGVGLVLLVLTWAAVSGPSGVIHGTPHDGIYHAPPPPTMSADQGKIGHPPPIDRTRPKPTTGIWALIGLVLRWLVRAVFAAALAWFAWWALQTLLARRRIRQAPVDAAFDIVDAPAQLARELVEDADAQFALLRSGSPRNAIVAAWDHFEERAELVGAARKPWETSSEFTLRLLSAVSADETAVSVLERLYHEARFSEHEIDEERRTSAVEALERIHASLRRRAGTSAEAQA